MKNIITSTVGGIVMCCGVVLFCLAFFVNARKDTKRTEEHQRIVTSHASVRLVATTPEGVKIYAVAREEHSGAALYVAVSPNTVSGVSLIAN